MAAGALHLEEGLIAKFAREQSLHDLGPARVIVLEVLALLAQPGHVLGIHAKDEQVLLACRLQ